MLREKVMRKWWEHEYLIDRFQIFSTSFPFDESRFATRLWTTQSVPRLHHPGCGFTCWTPKFSLLSGKFLLNQGFKSWIAKKKWLFESLARCMVNKWLWRNSVGLARSVRHSELFARVKLKSFHNQKWKEWLYLAEESWRLWSLYLRDQRASICRLLQEDLCLAWPLWVIGLYPRLRGLYHLVCCSTAANPGMQEM